MDKRVSERRSPGNSNRRKPCVQSEPQGDGGSKASDEALRFALTDAYTSHEKLVSPREEALLRREAAVEKLALNLQRREALLAADKVKSFVCRVQEISDAQIVKVTQECHYSKLRQVNEHLVVTSVEAQIKAEEAEKAKVALAHLANHDFLTNLPNRVQLYDRITQAIASAKRHHEKLAVLFLDLDRFKTVNDTLGHATGDRLLQEVAQRLQSAIRSSDTVSRQGGDEFILVISKVSEEENLALTAAKIHEIVTAPYSVAGDELQIGATIDISVFPKDGEDSETLIRKADDAMYYAKNNGRNKFQFFGKEIGSGSVK